MKFVVKNTTSGGLLDLVCPHICRGCGCLGTTLCERCKKNLLQTKIRICPLCRQTLARVDKPCPDCGLPLQGIFIGGWREGVLARLIKEYKYQAVWAHKSGLLDIAEAALAAGGELGQTVVVPLPTIGRHVRERGIDHTLRLAKGLARRRGWSCQRVLVRATDTVQVGAKATEREQQAAKAYAIARSVDPKQSYLLLDDIWTTGSSLLAAARVLEKAGARRIYGLVLAIGRNPEEN